jgi:hypothetical protein
MITENLGIITELPEPPKSDVVSFLILEDKEAATHSVIKSEGYKGNYLWINVQQCNIPNPALFKASFPNGAEAILITFEPSE